jgi:hypothetical protein
LIKKVVCGVFDDVERDIGSIRLPQWGRVVRLRSGPQFGFEHFRDGIYVIDLACVTLDNAVKQLRNRLVPTDQKPKPRLGYKPFCQPGYRRR